MWLGDGTHVYKFDKYKLINKCIICFLMAVHGLYEAWSWMLLSFCTIVWLSVKVLDWPLAFSIRYNADFGWRSLPVMFSVSVYYFSIIYFTDLIRTKVQASVVIKFFWGVGWLFFHNEGWTRGKKNKLIPSLPILCTAPKHLFFSCLKIPTKESSKTFRLIFLCSS